MNDYIAPAPRLDAFNCPHCGVYAQQTWHRVQTAEEPKNLLGRSGPGSPSNLVAPTSQKAKAIYGMLDLHLSRCTRCTNLSVWVEQNLVFPTSSPAPLPAQDMPDDIKDDYLEARNIVNASPRGAAALLRLAVEKLVIHLGGKGKKIDDGIADLVKKGLPEDIQKALDAVRVIGNNAVHPGQIDLTDDVATANSLFELLNFIVNRMITEQNKINTIYSGLPASNLAAIKKRDGKP